MKPLLVSLFLFFMLPAACMAFELEDEFDGDIEGGFAWYEGVSGQIGDFGAAACWEGAPDGTVYRADPDAGTVSVTYRVPGAAALRFSFYSRSPLYCAPARDGEAKPVPGFAVSSSAVSGRNVDAGKLIPLIDCQETGRACARVNGERYELWFSPEELNFVFLKALGPDTNDGVPGRLVYLWASGDGERYSPVAYSLAGARGGELETGSSAYNYYSCEARLPTGTVFVRFTVRDCGGYPIIGGGMMENRQKNDVYFASVRITYAGESPNPGPGPGGGVAPEPAPKPGPGPGEDPSPGLDNVPKPEGPGGPRPGVSGSDRGGYTPRMEPEAGKTVRVSPKYGDTEDSFGGNAPAAEEEPKSLAVPGVGAPLGTQGHSGGQEPGSPVEWDGALGPEEDWITPADPMEKGREELPVEKAVPTAATLADGTVSVLGKQNDETEGVLYRKPADPEGRAGQIMAAILGGAVLGAGAGGLLLSGKKRKREK